eukprot:TRINITY_DN21107_c0_g1_i1.p1 TRINITY_DN21107_c0_g1~~TRINITY_DN21107_c0_g1_i1.p1  ORF type:complete len:579 (-),score=101.47 TRINITY_DN21107_c0_g1_i1:1436-3172(-)
MAPLKTPGVECSRVTLSIPPFWRASILLIFGSILCIQGEPHDAEDLLDESYISGSSGSSSWKASRAIRGNVLPQPPLEMADYNISHDETGGRLLMVRLKYPAAPRTQILQKPMRFFHAARIHLALQQKKAGGSPLHFSFMTGGVANGVRVNLHWNESLEFADRPLEKWTLLEKEDWSSKAYSPYMQRLLDVRWDHALAEPEGKLTAKVEEEFQPFRVAFLVVGFALLLLAPLLSQQVAFYYGSGMTVGVLLVIIVVLYQMVRLLPLGQRKSSWWMLLYGSVMGLGAVAVSYVSSFVGDALDSLGFQEDWVSPVLVCVFLLIFLLGAALGFWIVRKFVLAPDGSLDRPTAVFVKWALRTAAVVLLLQASMDAALSLAALLGSILVIALITYVPWWRLPGLLVSVVGWPVRFVWRLCVWRKNSSSATFAGQLAQPPPSHDVPGTPTQEITSPKRDGMEEDTQEAGEALTTRGRGMSSRLGIRTSESPLLRHRWMASSVHSRNSPHYRAVRRNEEAEITRECTTLAMRDLLTSPAFNDWASGFVAAPREKMAREERQREEIERTADMTSGAESEGEEGEEE